MKVESKNNTKKIEGLFINQSIIFKNKNFEFFEEIYKTVILIIIKALNKITPNEVCQKKGKEKIRFINKQILFYYLLIISLITTINFKHSIIYKDSIVTLRVYNGQQQKIFNSGTKPNEVWIDNIKQQNVSNSYQLEPTNIVKLKWTNEINDCYFMFYGCNSIIEMNFTNFDATNCSTTAGMFRNCTSLKSLDLSGFKTSNTLKAMNNMFWNSSSLVSLNLSSFDTSCVTNFGHLFCNCQSLEWIDISNFNTENVKYLDNMFKGCKNLVSVNLSNFNTSKVAFMDNMFNGCESLKIIDFSNLDVTSVTNINATYVTDNIFSNCKNLEYLNIQNLNSNINLDNTFFKGSSKNLILCNEKDNIELSKIKISNNSDCKLNRCYNNYSNYNNKINTQGYDNNFGFESLLNNQCMINYIDPSKESSISTFDVILNKIENLFTSKEYDTSEIENGINDIIIYENMIVTLTSTKNQKN